MFQIKKPAQPYRNTRILSSAWQRAAGLAFCTTYCSFHRKIQLQQLQLTDEGIIVLGVTRKDGTYIGAPKGDTGIQPHDLLILYGRSASLAKLDRRRQGAEGDRDHVRGVAEQEEIQQQEEIKDESAGGKEEEIPSV